MFCTTAVNNLRSRFTSRDCKLDVFGRNNNIKWLTEWQHWNHVDLHCRWFMVKTRQICLNLCEAETAQISNVRSTGVNWEEHNSLLENLNWLVPFLCSLIWAWSLQRPQTGVFLANQSGELSQGCCCFGIRGEVFRDVTKFLLKNSGRFYKKIDEKCIRECLFWNL